MTMSKPRSMGESFVKRRYKTRDYPYRLRVTEYVAKDVECEACSKTATHSVVYEERENQPETLEIKLCEQHMRQSAGSAGFKAVLFYVDRKVDRREKK